MNQMNFDIAVRFSVQIGDMGQSQQQQHQQQNEQKDNRYHDLERNFRDTFTIEEDEDYFSDDSVDYVLNKAHLYPEQITKNDILKIVTAPTHTTTVSWAQRCLC
jgi:hypothetical protein